MSHFSSAPPSIDESALHPSRSQASSVKPVRLTRPTQEGRDRLRVREPVDHRLSGLRGLPVLVERVPIAHALQHRDRSTLGGPRQLPHSLGGSGVLAFAALDDRLCVRRGPHRHRRRCRSRAAAQRRGARYQRLPDHLLPSVDRAHRRHHGGVHLDPEPANRAHQRALAIRWACLGQRGSSSRAGRSSAW